MRREGGTIAVLRRIGAVLGRLLREVICAAASADDVLDPLLEMEEEEADMGRRLEEATPPCEEDGAEFGRTGERDSIDLPLRSPPEKSSMVEVGFLKNRCSKPTLVEGRGPRDLE